MTGHRQVFRTRQADDGPRFIRTCGLVVPTSTGDLLLPHTDALHHAHPYPPVDCARGKVAGVGRRHGRSEAVCYQVSDCRTQAHVVACCNATAAAAAVLGPDSNRLGKVTLSVELPGKHRIRVEAGVRGSAVGGKTVQQRWHDVPFAMHREIDVDGRRCTVCASPLNNYLVILTRPGEDAADFAVAEAVALWRRFELDREPLLSRMAVVQGGDGRGEPPVKFFTCGDREHPSAPLTGLAVLSIAAQRLGWAALRGAEHVVTRVGRMRLPRVDNVSDGTATIEFPTLVVDLEPYPVAPVLLDLDAIA